MAVRQMSKMSFNGRQAAPGWQRPITDLNSVTETPLQKCERETAGQEWFTDPCAYLRGGGVEPWNCGPNALWVKNRGCVYNVDLDTPQGPGPPVLINQPGSIVDGSGTSDVFDKLRSIYDLVMRHPYLFGAGGFIFGYLIYSYFSGHKGKR